MPVSKCDCLTPMQRWEVHSQTELSAECSVANHAMLSCCKWLQNLVLVNMHGIAIHVSMVHSMLAYTMSFTVTVRVAT